MANLITLLRFILLFVLVGMTYKAPPLWQLLNPLLLIVIISLDAVDGYVARKRGETSVFGAVIDIAVDRVVENILWIVLADLELVPIWVAIVFVTRGLLVDSIRWHAAAQGETAFSMMRSHWGQILVAGRFMRGLYGTIKAITFSWVLLIQPWPQLAPDLWAQWSNAIDLITDILVYISVFLCLARGLPVLVEFFINHGSERNSGAIEES